MMEWLWVKDWWFIVDNIGDRLIIDWWWSVTHNCSDGAINMIKWCRNDGWW